MDGNTSDPKDGDVPMRFWHVRRWPKFFRDTYIPSRSVFDYRPESPAGIFRKLSKAPIFEHYTFKNIYQSLWVFAGCMISLSIIGAVHHYGGLPEGFPIMYAALGASATIMFHQPSAPFTQPYHLLIGHTVCPAISVTFQKILPSQPWLASALAGSLGITVMGLLGRSTESNTHLHSLLTFSVFCLLNRCSKSTWWRSCSSLSSCSTTSCIGILVYSWRACWH